MADVIDSKGGDKLLPPRMQRSGVQRFLLEDGELIQQSATTVTTGESSSKQDNKNKGFLSKLQTFKLKFDQLDQERASRILFNNQYNNNQCNNQCNSLNQIV